MPTSITVLVYNGLASILPIAILFNDKNPSTPRIITGTIVLFFALSGGMIVFYIYLGLAPVFIYSLVTIGSVFSMKVGTRRKVSILVGACLIILLWWSTDRKSVV